MRLGSLMRVITLSALIACALAVIVARSAPPAGVFHLRSEPHRVVFDEMYFSVGGSEARVLDTRTGDLSPLVLPGAEKLQRVSFSDRVNDRGEWEVVGRWVRHTAKGVDCGVESTGVGRFVYPSGRALDRLPLDLVPASPPCWYPGDPPRVLFAATDGRLYRVTFRDGVGQSDADEPDVHPIAWPNPPEGLQNSHVTSLVWHKDPRLGNTLIATVGCAPPREGSGGHGRQGFRFRLWWLRLDASGSQIVDAGRLFSDEVDQDEQFGSPSVTSLSDGELVMAFHRRPRLANLGDVYVVRLDIDDRTGAPVARLSDSRKMAEGCTLVPAPFSPDGRWVYALERRPDGSAHLARHELSSVLPSPRS